MLPAVPLPAGDLVAVLVVDDRVDPEHAGAAAARFHRLQGRQGAAEEAAVLGLPPGVDDDGVALADDVVVPAPHVGLDRLTDRGHVLEAVVVLGRLVGAELAQHADRRRRGVEDVDPEPFGDPPRTTGIGIGGHPLVDHAGRAERQRAVDDVGVAGDPADVGHAPVGVVGVDVLVVLRGAGDVGEVAAGAVLAALGSGRGAAGVHQEQRRLGGHRHRLDDACRGTRRGGRRRRSRVRRPSGSARRTAGVASPDEHLVDVDAEFARRRHRLVGLGLVVDQLAVAVVAVHRHQDVARRVGDAVPAGGAAEPAEHLGVDDTQPGAGEHRDGQLGDHRQVEGHPVADGHAGQRRAARRRTR